MHRDQVASGHHTLFANEGVVSVIRIVGISSRRAATIANCSKVEFFSTLALDDVAQPTPKSYREIHDQIVLNDQSYTKNTVSECPRYVCPKIASLTSIAYRKAR